MEIELFGASWCPGCKQAKKWLDDRKVDYVYQDIDNPVSEQKLIKMGFRSIPVLVVDNQVISGYNPEKMGDLINEPETTE